MFIKIAAPNLFKYFVTKNSTIANMSYFKENDKRLIRHPHALYATDVTFQQSNRPCGNMMDAKPYFSGKS